MKSFSKALNNTFSIEYTLIMVYSSVAIAS